MRSAALSIVPRYMPPTALWILEGFALESWLVVITDLQQAPAFSSAPRSAFDFAGTARQTPPQLIVVEVLMAQGLQTSDPISAIRNKPPISLMKGSSAAVPP